MSNGEPQAQPVSPSMQMMQMLWPGAMAVQAIHVAAKLALADLVAGGPKSIRELADATHTHGPSMARLLRALTSLGIFVEDTTGRYRQTALSDTLRSDHPESIRPFAMMVGAIPDEDRKSTRLNSSHSQISYAVFCLKKKIAT